MNTSRLVLVVENDFMVSEVISELLKTRGHEVISVRNGEEAMKLIGTPFYAVVTDMLARERGLNGNDVAEAIMKFHPETKRILTYSSLGVLPKDGNFTRVFSRPFEVDEFLAAVA